MEEHNPEYEKHNWQSKEYEKKEVSGKQKLVCSGDVCFLYVFIR